MTTQEKELYKKVKAKNYRKCCKMVQDIFKEHHDKLKFQDRKNKDEWHAAYQILEMEIKEKIKKSI